MELMIFSMLVIVVVLMTYLFVEQSVLHRVMWIDPIEHWQEYFDTLARIREADAQFEARLADRRLHADQRPLPFWYTKLFSYFR